MGEDEQAWWAGIFDKDILVHTSQFSSVERHYLQLSSLEDPSVIKRQWEAPEILVSWCLSIESIFLFVLSKRSSILSLDLTTGLRQFFSNPVITSPLQPIYIHYFPQSRLVCVVYENQTHLIVSYYSWPLSENLKDQELASFEIEKRESRYSR